MRHPNLRTGKAAQVAVALCLGGLWSTATGQTEPVDLQAFGLADVAAVSQCVAKRLPTAITDNVALTYWGQHIRLEGRCVVPDMLADEVVGRSRARFAFLNALQQCTGIRHNDDQVPWVRRVAYANSIIAATGVFLNEQQVSRLQWLQMRTAECAPPKEERGGPEQRRDEFAARVRRFEEGAKSVQDAKQGGCQMRALPDGSKKVVCS